MSDRPRAVIRSDGSTVRDVAISAAVHFKIHPYATYQEKKDKKGEVISFDVVPDQLSKAPSTVSVTRLGNGEFAVGYDPGDYPQGLGGSLTLPHRIRRIEMMKAIMSSPSY